MEIIQQIGSYAGLAAIVGLAVLAGLYISQARDVKRLREWAGRAPERVATPYQPPRPVVARPAPPPTPPGGGGPAKPASPPAPSQAAAAGAAPAVAAGPVAATPAAARAAEAAPATDALTQNTVSYPSPRPPPQTLPPRPTPPGLGGHFARQAQLARAKEETKRVDGAGAAAPPGGEGEPGAPAEEPVDTEHEHPEGDWDETGEREELAEEDLEQDPEEEYVQDSDDPDAAALPDPEEEYVQDSDDPDAAALPDPEDFHEGDEPAEEPDTGSRPAAAASTPPTPPPPPPITATRQPLPPRPAPPPRAPQGPILPPYEQSRPGGGSWENRTISPAKAALAVGGTVVVVAAAAFGVLQLTRGEDEGSAPARQQSSSVGGEDRPSGASRPARAAVNPRTVTVSVLNGTTVGGLAAELGDKLEGQGFQLGNVTNNTDQQRAESVVLFAPGAEEEAEDVGRRLKIDQREPIDPDSQTRAGDASVVVVAGADLDR